MARSLTVFSLLFQSTTYCRYRVYTKFLLTYTAMYRRKVLPLGITALRPQSHFHLGTPYIRTQFMVVTQEYRTYFVSSRLHLLHGVGEKEPTANFCQMNYGNNNGVKWKLKNASIPLIPIYQRRCAACSLQKK